MYCGVFPSEVVESELFGHEKGEFASANALRVVHFEAAYGGTFFLDEIGELSKRLKKDHL
ncbi:MAG: sigma 54-interacting transcriptional regulator [Pseudomonadota bacterium]